MSIRGLSGSVMIHGAGVIRISKVKKQDEGTYKVKIYIENTSGGSIYSNLDLVIFGDSNLRIEQVTP